MVSWPFLYFQFLSNAAQGAYIFPASPQDTKAMQSSLVRMVGSLYKEDRMVQGEL